MKKNLAISIVLLVLLLIIGSLVLTSCSGDTKQVPVYYGMSISQTAPNTQNGNAGLMSPEAIPDLGITLLSAGNKHDPFGSGGHKLKGKYKEMYDSSIAVGNNNELFYTKPNEDVYITVHVSNPDKFEILSFTLNGTKYSSYMFEDGSDLENLILKCNVGNKEGIVEYTIDSIKYVDETTIKDVKMEGDPTVKLASYTPNQPTATIESIVTGFNKIDFTVKSDDPMKLIKDSKGKMFAVLYDGKTILHRKELPVGQEKSVTFDQLSSGTEYQCAIVAEYDSLNGEGMNAYVLAEKVVTTPSIVAFSNVEIGDTNLKFVLDWAKDFKGDKKLTDLSLYEKDALVSKLSTSATDITGLLSNHTYRLVATFVNKGASETSTLEFTTKTNTVPTLGIIRDGWTPTSISFKLNIDDDDNTVTDVQLELLDQDGKLLKTLGDSIRTVDSLEPTFLYTVQATFTYDLRDGEGPQTAKRKVKMAPQSSGLEMYDDMVIGIGTCTDSTVYIAYPIVDSAFKSNTTIKHLILGSGVTSLGGNAFHSCISLESVYCYEGLKILEGGYIFYNCPRLKSVYLPNSLTTTSVSQNATASSLFHDCKSLREVHLPENLKDLPIACFKNCSSLTEIDIPDSVTIIPKQAFRDCIALKNIHLPEGITRIDDYAFSNCTVLTTINMPKGITEIGDEAFFKCASLKAIEIPPLVKTISTSLFSNCTALESVRLPDGILKINNSAFRECSALKTINLPQTVTEIGNYAFQQCTALESIELPPLITTISRAAFDDCRALKTVQLPDGITTIGENAFSSCYALKHIQLHDSIIQIGDSAFSACTALDNIVIPRSVLLIGAYAFSTTAADYICCLSPQTSVNCGNNWNGSTSVIWDFKEFSSDSQGLNFAVMNSGKMVVLSYSGTKKQVVIPKGVTRIEQNAFAEILHLTSVTLPEGLESIGRNAFYHCKLTEIVIPDGVKIIEESAFEGCCYLESVRFPDSLTTIGDRAFELCGLQTLILPQNITSIGAYAFAGNEFESVTIPGSLKMIPRGAFENCEKLKQVTICEGIKEIDTQAFCMSNILETLVLPNGFTTIRDGAFEGVFALKSITIPNTVTSIGSDAFYGSYRLEEITYLGTKAEWNAISKKNNWLSECYLSVIHCTDGDIVYS